MRIMSWAARLGNRGQPCACASPLLKHDPRRLWGQPGYRTVAGLAVTSSQPTPRPGAGPTHSRPAMHDHSRRSAAIGRRGIELPSPFAIRNRILRRIGRANERAMGHATRLLPGMARFFLGAFWGAFRRFSQKALAIRGLPLASTVRYVVNIITETCDIPRETIKPESHAIHDLGIDSLDFLDIAFAIDKTFGIKMPLSSGPRRSTRARRTTDQYFVLQNLPRIDELVAAKGVTLMLA